MPLHQWTYDGVPSGTTLTPSNIEPPREPVRVRRLETVAPLAHVEFNGWAPTPGNIAYFPGVTLSMDDDRRLHLGEQVTEAIPEGPVDIVIRNGVLSWTQA